MNDNAAATINRIVLELKGLYTGPDRINTTGTNYWSSAEDFWIFDRGLNSSTGGTARSLKLARTVSLNGATLDAVNGLHTDGVNDFPTATGITGSFNGASLLARMNFRSGVNSAGLWRLGTSARDSGTSGYMHQNVIVGQVAGTTGVLLQGLAIPANGLPMLYTGILTPATGTNDMWVSANGAQASCRIGTVNKTDGDVQFGAADNNFAPTELGWGYKRGTNGTPGSFLITNTKFSALLRRTTTAAERDQIMAILALP